MKGFLISLLVMCVVALAVWAYSENYTTQRALNQVDQLNRDIASAKARLRVLNAEWAWLNRPERLSELARLNFENLELLHLQPDHFGQIDEIPMAVDRPVDFADTIAREATE